MPRSSPAARGRPPTTVAAIVSPGCSTPRRLAVSLAGGRWSVARSRPQPLCEARRSTRSPRAPWRRHWHATSAATRAATRERAGESDQHQHPVTGHWSRPRTRSLKSVTRMRGQVLAAAVRTHAKMEDGSAARRRATARGEPTTAAAPRVCAASGASRAREYSPRGPGARSRRCFDGRLGRAAARFGQCDPGQDDRCAGEQVPGDRLAEDRGAERDGDDR
jgi:hypothetical protein